jgi:hypothetical protein
MEGGWVGWGAAAHDGAVPPPPLPRPYRVAPDPGPGVDVDGVAHEPGGGRGAGGEGEGGAAGEGGVGRVAGRRGQRAKLERERARARRARRPRVAVHGAGRKVGPGEGEAGRGAKGGRHAVGEVDRGGEQAAAVPRDHARRPHQIRVRGYEGAQGADGELKGVHARVDGKGQGGGRRGALFPGGALSLARRPRDRGRQPGDVAHDEVRREGVQGGEPNAALAVAAAARQRLQVVAGKRVLDVGVVRGFVHAAHGGPEGWGEKGGWVGDRSSLFSPWPILSRLLPTSTRSAASR